MKTEPYIHVIHDEDSRPIGEAWFCKASRGGLSAHWVGKLRINHEWGPEVHTADTLDKVADAIRQEAKTWVPCGHAPLWAPRGASSLAHTHEDWVTR